MSKDKDSCKKNGGGCSGGGGCSHSHNDDGDCDCGGNCSHSHDDDGDGNNPCRDPNEEDGGDDR